MIFETESIYRVNPEDGCLDFRLGEIGLIDADMGHEDFNAPFYVTGVCRHDLAIFGTFLGESGVGDGGFLVVSSSSSRGQLATPEIIDGLSLYTAELAKKIATLKDEELAQLGIDGLASNIRKRYPGMRGLVR